jgi:putative CocE/NonD family hydrolase
VPDSFAFLHDYPDEAETTDRADVVCFTTTPSDTDLDIAGPVDLFIAMSSTAPTTHLFAKLYDVEPDGACHMIVRGQGELLDASGERLLHLEMGHTGYRLRPGHRLRLALSSSDFPEFVPHPGTDENPWLAVDTKPSTQIIHRTPELAPYLELSVLSADE